MQQKQYQALLMFSSNVAPLSLSNFTSVSVELDPGDPVTFDATE